MIWLLFAQRFYFDHVLFLYTKYPRKFWNLNSVLDRSAAHPKSYALTVTGYNNETCCNDFNCTCVYYNYFGQNYSVGDTFLNPNNTCEDRVLKIAGKILKILEFLNFYIFSKFVIFQISTGIFRILTKEFIVVVSYPCPDLRLVPRPCPELHCPPCEKKVAINETNCCGTIYECQRTGLIYHEIWCWN